ncbi:DUF559 domain-containing protein [Xanthobacter sp. V4C-4]|uniref:endonuclease domain-containing protein n=1 Tax=Xanthobacter cornucopiae TaxID=3119924 RepID=UPI00372B1B35
MARAPAVASGVPEWRRLSALVGHRRAVAVAGIRCDQMVAASDMLGADAGVRLALYPLAAPASFAGLVDGLLDHLATTLGGLWPAWHPLAARFDADSALARAALDLAAADLAPRLGVSPAWLRRAGARALAGEMPRAADLPPPAELHDLCAAITCGSGGRRLVIALDPRAPEAAFGPWLEALCRWVVNHADVDVWITEPAARWDTLSVLRPPGDAAARTPPPAEDARAPSLPFFGGILGQPNPHSPAELALARALARADWAGAFGFNRMVDITARPKVDILWEQERLVVEIDGADHRARTKYAQDRDRDFALLHAGYVVLRLTNEQVLGDLQLSLAKVKAVLARRRDAGISRIGWGP